MTDGSFVDYVSLEDVESGCQSLSMREDQVEELSCDRLRRQSFSKLLARILVQVG